MICLALLAVTHPVLLKVFEKSLSMLMNFHLRGGFFIFFILSRVFVLVLVLERFNWTIPLVLV